MPPEFAYPGAFVDLTIAIIAFALIPLVLLRSRLGKPFVWVFNIFGTVDLLVAITTRPSSQWEQRIGSLLFGFRCYS